MWQIYTFIWNFLKGGKGNKEMVWMNLKSGDCLRPKLFSCVKMVSENIKTVLDMHQTIFQRNFSNHRGRLNRILALLVPARKYSTKAHQLTLAWECLSVKTWQSICEKRSYLLHCQIPLFAMAWE